MLEKIYDEEWSDLRVLTGAAEYVLEAVLGRKYHRFDLAVWNNLCRFVLYIGDGNFWA